MATWAEHTVPDRFAGVLRRPTTTIVGEEHVTFGRNVMLDDFVLIIARAPIVFGDHIHVACFASVTGGESVEVGDCSAISQGARILTATDDFTGSGFGNSTVPEEFRNTYRSPVSIGRFVIVGANSVVLPGVTIGEGATVGACSVVTRDLEPWGVYVGTKRLRDRDRSGVLAAYERFRERDS
jgi:acetyltransferase-like isoleucine patch superfamily enzyme